MSTPGRLTAAAVVQLVSGMLNLFVTWWVSGFIVSTAGAVCSSIVSLGTCPLGVFCGFASWALIPLGLAEVIVGIVGLINPKSSGTAIRYMAFIEIPSILIGGVGSLIAGFASIALLNDDEVRLFQDIDRR